MASRLFASVAFLCLAPGMAAANGLGIPGFGDDLGERPSYAEGYDAYPPEQHNILGMPEAPPSPYDRPSYREAYDDYPPPAGRYGGGFIEYLMTGGRPGPAAAPVQAAPVYAEPVYAAPAPAYAVSVPAYATPLYPPAAPAYAATASRTPRRLPRSGLPEYAPDQPAAAFGAR